MELRELFMNHLQKIGAGVFNMSLAFSIKQLISYVLVIVLIVAGFELGSLLADMIYYNVFNGADPYQGFTRIRLVLSFFFSGLLSSCIGIVYSEVIKLKYKYTSYFLGYFTLVFILLMSEIITSGFPVNARFWVYEIGVLLLTASILIFIHKSFNSKKTL